MGTSGFGPSDDWGTIKCVLQILWYLMMFYDSGTGVTEHYDEFLIVIYFVYISNMYTVLSVMNYFICAGHRSWRWSDPGGVAVSVQPSTTLRRVHHSNHQWKSDRVHQGPGVAGTEVSQSQILSTITNFQITTTNQSQQIRFTNFSSSICKFRISGQP